MFNRTYFASIASTFTLLASLNLCWAQEPAQQSTRPEVREAWRKSMVRIPLPKKGCFTASYPNMMWKEVPCGEPSKHFNQPQSRGGTGSVVNTVGGHAGDYSAISAGLIASAEGAFTSVNGAASVTGPLFGGPTTDPNIFMFQINTQFFPNTPACNGVAGCEGWEQFLYSQTQGPAPGPGQSSVVPGTTPAVFIEYWLLFYGSTCPSGPWQSDGVGDCVFNGPTTYVPPQTITSLPNLKMTASTSGGAGGQDTVILYTPGDSTGDLKAVGQESVLSLASYWNTAEFNIFGDCCSSETVFSNPTTLVVKTTIDDGTTNAPTCGTFSFTAEQNNLTMAPTASPVCCPYGGATPAIEFMESNAGHTATCGPTALEGDPHITTADGTHYNFQGAGEYISLRDRSGEEIQTRQKPVSTTFIGTDAYDGLTTCVSLNTAVAARVGEHRVTWEPNLSGVPDPSGLQLRIDGTLKSLGASGMALGAGGRVAPAPGGGLEVDFPSGKTLLVTPEWWASQSEWYLNVDVSHGGLVSGIGSTSGQGIAGPIAEGSWLPALPNGASMGAMPSSLSARYNELYGKFGNAWRVNNENSLFDYAPGTSTESFTMRDWPKENPPCTVPETKPVEPASEAIAVEACRRVTDRNRHADCVFDVRATGNIGFAKTYLVTQRILADATSISLTDDTDPSQVGESVTFTAYVVASSTEAKGYPSGSVQFVIDGMNAGEPVTVDAKGRAKLETAKLKAGEHRVTASYLPGADSLYLPSTSLEKIQLVKRCMCDAESAAK